MNGITRRGFLKSAGAVAVGAAVVETTEANERRPLPAEMILKEGWFIQSSTLVDKSGEAVSGSGFATEGWHKATMPCTVLSALVKNGVYPDPRNGLDCHKIPDSSDEFNQKYGLAKFSHLPDKRNPWRDPYWYRTEFTLPTWQAGRHVWVNFDCINYRAEVWLNGAKIADKDRMAGMFQRFRFDVTAHARPPRRPRPAVAVHRGRAQALPQSPQPRDVYVNGRRLHDTGSLLDVAPARHRTRRHAVLDSVRLSAGLHQGRSNGEGGALRALQGGPAHRHE